jgi:hypothetical protein
MKGLVEIRASPVPSYPDQDTPEESSLSAANLLLLLLALPVVGDAPWRAEEVGDGVVWKSKRFEDLFGAPQSVNLLEVDLGRGQARIRFAAAQGKETTSALAARTRAIAAVNGGYFDVKTGAPLGLLKIEGALLSSTLAEREATIGVLGNEEVRIRPSPRGDWKEAAHALSAGPILVEEGRVRVGGGFGHEKVRHPRTAVGLAKGYRLLLVAVDGRAPEAAGMTLEELARFLVDLGCVTALNLDGGGSTTMWVRGEPFDGVVNFPCDDRRFDHLGERAVANALLVLAHDVVVADTDEAEFVPPERWTRSSDGTGFLGEDYALAPRGDEVTARWTVPIEFSGEFEAFARWPKGISLATGTIWRVGSTEKTLGQARGGGEWVSLGTIRVEAPGPISVELSGTTKEPLAADAVRFVER